MGTEQAVRILDNLADSKNSPLTCQGIGGIRSEGEEGVRGGVRFPGLGPWSGEGPEGQAERSVWLCQRNAGEKPLPVGEIKLFPREASALPKARPIHPGIWEGGRR